MALLLRDKIQPGPILRSRGFALPTILIASVVMLMVLLVSVTSTTAIRTAMFNQYYSQLAQVAGEAGVEYAKACLNASANVPGWSDAKPLMPNTDCSGNVQGGYPAYVTTSGNIRSGFSLGMPTLDSSDRAKTLPNSGYVEITRKSNTAAVWRRYNQPSVQAAVVPDLCSGTATSALGWSNATVRTSSYGPSEADPISISTTNISPGPMYFRKDFSVVKSASYTFSIYANDIAEVYIDGGYLMTANRAVSGTNTLSTTTSLSVGCHTIMIKLTNTEILQNASVLVASLTENGSSTPTIVTDTAWRVSTGLQKHFSDVNYYADPLSWTVIRDLGLANSINAGWGAASGDSGARYVSTTHSYDGSGNYPAGFTLFRDNRIIELSQSAVVKITMMCDGDCYPYMDGNLLNNGITTVPASFTITLTEGSHKLAFLASNVSGTAGYAFTAVDTATGALITHTDSNWSAANFWSTTNPGSSTSYDNSYEPNPNPIPKANIAALVVGGGGGGASGVGGGGGGGGVATGTVSLYAGTMAVTVGAGGTAGVNNDQGALGGSSSFSTLIGGAGGIGGSQNAVASQPPTHTGSGAGGGGGTNQPNQLTAGSAGTNGMASAGAAGIQNSRAGGGGGASAAASGVTGGAGYTSSISGVSTVYGSGGGGGIVSGSVATGGANAGSGGVSNTTNATSGVANTGGGGGGSGGTLSPNFYYGTAGAGGSGIVIISYLTGSMTATGGTITTSGGNTIHRFTSSGTFTVTSIP